MLWGKSTMKVLACSLVTDCFTEGYTHHQQHLEFGYMCSFKFLVHSIVVVLILVEEPGCPTWFSSLTLQCKYTFLSCETDAIINKIPFKASVIRCQKERLVKTQAARNDEYNNLNHFCTWLPAAKLLMNAHTMQLRGEGSHAALSLDATFSRMH